MKLFSIGCRRVSSRGFRDQSGEGEERCSHNLQSDQHMRAGQRYLQAANDLRCYSWCRRECFLLQTTCMTQASVEIILSVTLSFGLGKWAKIEGYDGKPLRAKTRNRHHRSTEEYIRENSESEKQYARTVWASLISSLSVARYDCFPQRFSLTFQPPLISLEN